ncbi:MAG: hypothetical protein KVP17_002462 [Porospora cf. gigantea B]|uniref:uncharacterized protein n=1 Tax=Porospora cf. gigantea B TaxID=2853592 RepID=UPI003571E064|nr:MAG: hypothetical protein KVP17_002462 [Porospora cf. gigantea B]
MSNVVVIVGLGLSGLAAFRELKQLNRHRFLLIEPRDYLLDCVRLPLSLTTPEEPLDKLVHPLNVVGPDSEHIRGFVTSVSDTHLTVEMLDGTALELSLSGGETGTTGTSVMDEIKRNGIHRLIMCTGIQKAVCPGKRQVLTIDTFKSEFQALKDSVSRCQHVLVNGGGPTSLEMAGFLRKAGMSVTVICRDEILKGQEQGFQRRVASELQRQGIDVRTHTTLVSPIHEFHQSFPSFSVFGAPQTLELSADVPSTVEAIDLYVQGFTADRDLQFEVNDQFLTKEDSKIQAIGGCANIETDMFYFAEKQASHLASHFSDPQAYAHPMSVMLLDLGGCCVATADVSWLGRCTFSNFFTSGLACFKYRKMLSTCQRLSGQ